MAGQVFPVFSLKFRVIFCYDENGFLLKSGLNGKNERSIFQVILFREVFTVHLEQDILGPFWVFYILFQNTEVRVSYSPPSSNCILNILGMQLEDGGE